MNDNLIYSTIRESNSTEWTQTLNDYAVRLLGLLIWVHHLIDSDYTRFIETIANKNDLAGIRAQG